jgi:anti-sigma regulatory factor (Ser/Thr protein kinase)
MRRSTSVDLTLDLTAPHAARSVTCTVLRHWGITDDDALEAATIVVSELVTNALSHVGDDGGAATLTLDLSGGVLHVGVRDGSVAVPRMRTARPDDTSGRGLSIVEQLSTRWGTESHPDGKRVFAELPVLPAAVRADSHPA